MNRQQKHFYKLLVKTKTMFSKTNAQDKSKYKCKVQEHSSEYKNILILDSCPRLDINPTDLQSYKGCLGKGYTDNNTSTNRF